MGSTFIAETKIISNTKTMKQQTIQISGMSCSGCANMVAENISQLEGVEDVRVILDKNAAAVKYHPEKVTVNDLKKAVEKSGYGFEGVK